MCSKVTCDAKEFWGDFGNLVFQDHFWSILVSYMFYYLNTAHSTYEWAISCQKKKQLINVHILCLASAKRLFSGIACQKALIVSDIVDQCIKQMNIILKKFFFRGSDQFLRGRLPLEVPVHQ